MILSRPDTLTCPSCGRKFCDFIWGNLFIIFNLFLKVFQKFLTFCRKFDDYQRKKSILEDLVTSLIHKFKEWQWVL